MQCMFIDILLVTDDNIQPIGHIRTKIKGLKRPIMIYDVSEKMETAEK